jgi:response regulator RpfG family c-di-GMP phosphodiesterase
VDRLLFVDDEPFVLRALKRTFELEGFEVVTTLKPAEALDLLRDGAGGQFVVIGSDYRMPDMNGAEFLHQARELSPQSYRLLISAVEEFHAAVDAINRGEIYRFVPKPWDRDDLLAIVRAAVDDYHLRRNYQEMTALLHAKNTELSTLNKSLEDRVSERTRDLLEALVSAVDQRCAEAVHSRKVAAFAVRLGRELGLSEAELTVLHQGALIHDLGKIAVPDSILLKGGGLLAEEWAHLKRHPELGYRMLANVPSLDQARRLVLTHHERYDGGGYPLGLSGEQLPLGARILHVCEAYESMTAGRSFRPPRGDAEVRTEIERCSGSQFDPGVVAAFLRIPSLEWLAVGQDAVPATPLSPTLKELKGSFASAAPSAPKPDGPAEKRAAGDG